jgi:hypothetical protein
VPEEGTAEAEQTVDEGGSDNESEEDNSILIPSKPSHIEFGKSTVTAKDLVVMKKLGYFGENEDKLIRFAGEEVILEPKEDEVVVFRSFFRAGLRSPLYDMIGEVLKRFEIYLHQLTPNAIVRLNIYIWALQSQGKMSHPVLEGKPNANMYVPGSAIHVHSSYITWTSSHSAQIVLKREIVVDYIICLRHPHSFYNKSKCENKT